MSGMAMLGLIIYAAVIFACLTAARAALLRADRRGDVLHWGCAALVFAGIIMLRLTGAEDRFRGTARHFFQSVGDYDGRAAMQVPLAIAIAVAAFLLLWLFYRQWRAHRPRSRARLVLLARFALFGLMPLYGLRLVSLHVIDQLLYSGPLRINWLIEAAICLAVGGAGWLYARREIALKRR